MENDNSLLSPVSKLESDSVGKIIPALVGFQSEIATIAKTKDNPFFKSKYADLATILEAVRPAMTKHGLCDTYRVIDKVMIVTVFHTSGEWLKSHIPLQPVKNDPQGMGSAMTYARRQGIMGILGLAADDDDDGNAASQRSHKPPQQNSQVRARPEISSDNPKTFISLNQAKRLWAIAKSNNLTDDGIKTILSDFGYESSKDIKTADYEKICNAMGAQKE